MVASSEQIVVKGRLIKIGSLCEEWDDDIENPEEFLRSLKRTSAKMDIFSFVQRLPESVPNFDYFMEWDSVAAIPITTYENWIKRQIAQNSRKKIGFAQRKGVEIRRMTFNDDLVKGILSIYHEAPILQGTPNTQYNTDYQTAKRLNSTYLDRAHFIGAFYKDELIAYIKLVSSEKFMRTMGILSKIAHREKGAMNLLLATAVQICVEQNMPYLTFGKFNYGKRGSRTLKTFKKNLGFESIILPRYYIPLTSWGSLVLDLGLHREIVEYLPQKLIWTLLEVRKSYYTTMYKRKLSRGGPH